MMPGQKQVIEAQNTGWPWLGLALAACALSGLTVLSVSAAEKKNAIDPHADELLKRMGDYLGQAQFFSVSVEVWQDVELASGQRVQSGRTIDLQVRRPNRLRAEVHSTRHVRASEAPPASLKTPPDRRGSR